MTQSRGIYFRGIPYSWLLLYFWYLGLLVLLFIHFIWFLIFQINLIFTHKLWGCQSSGFLRISCFFASKIVTLVILPDPKSFFLYVLGGGSWLYQLYNYVQPDIQFFERHSKHFLKTINLKKSRSREVTTSSFSVSKSSQNWLKVAKMVGFQGLKTKNFLATAR